MTVSETVRICCALLVWSVALCSPHHLRAQAASFPTETIDAILRDSDFEDAWWGVQVVNLETAEVLYAHHAQRNFVPASVAKLFTTAAALEQLGPSYRYETHLYRDGPVQAGTLGGNLIIRGSGDPFIGQGLDKTDPLRLFQQWADTLRAHGITEVEGDIIGDDDLFADEARGYEWSWTDLTYYWAPEISALSFNDNVIDFAIRSQQEGQPGVVSWFPPTSYVEVINETTTGPRGSALEEGYERRLGTNIIVLSSQVPQGTTDREALTVANPTLYFCHVFRETLEARGIAVRGTCRDVDEVAQKPVYHGGPLAHLATHRSPPLREIVSETNKASNNLYAELLLRTLGVHRPVAEGDLEPGSSEMGLAAAQATFARAAIDTSRLQLVDGSGLSRHNLLSPAMTTQLLAYMWTHPDEEVRAAFLESLPVGGREGTLYARYRSGAAAGRVRAKTGSMSYVVALGGYVTTSAGTPLAFALYCNNHTVRNSVVRRAQDRIVNLLAGLRVVP